MADKVVQVAVESIGQNIGGGANKVAQVALESMGFTLSVVSQNRIFQNAVEILEPVIATGNENDAFTGLAIGNGEYVAGAIAGGAFMAGAYGNQTR